jgi:hypothetical protein
MSDRSSERAVVGAIKVRLGLMPGEPSVDEQFGASR